MPYTIEFGMLLAKMSASKPNRNMELTSFAQGKSKVVCVKLLLVLEALLRFTDWPIIVTDAKS